MSHTQLYRVYAAVKCVLCILPIQVHTHLEQWAADTAAPGEQGAFGALLKGFILVVDNSCRSRDLNPQPRVISAMLYPLEPRLPRISRSLHILAYHPGATHFYQGAEARCGEPNLLGLDVWVGGPPGMGVTILETNL